MNVTIEDIVTIPLGRAAKYGTMPVNVTMLPEHVKTYVFEYGLRQVLNDAMAEKKDDDGNDLPDAAIVAKADKRLKNLYEGVLRSRTAGEPIDPFEAECYREAKRTVEQALRAKGLFRDIPKGTKDRFMFVVNRARAAAGKPEIEEAAYVAEVLALPMGEAIKRRAKAAMKARDEANIDELV